MDPVLSAIQMVINPEILLLLLAGVAGGIAIGAIPGLTATMAVAILTSFTFGMSAIEAIMVLLGIYVGGVYGGSISAILLHIPGTPSAIMTARDGYPMAKQGLAGQAIGISTTASFLGGMISVVFLVLGAPIISRFALKFSAPEYFALAIFGLSIIANVSGKSLLKGLIAAALGILLSAIGMDPITGIQRFTFNEMNLQTGLNFVPLMIGLFGLSEILQQLRNVENHVEVRQEIKNVVPSFSLLKRLSKVIVRSSLIGTFIGALPGAGGTIASFAAYNDAKQTSQHPEKFGEGIPEGVAAPEAANNATVGGALMPLLTLGVPGDAITAILIGAFMIHSLQPGPMLFRNNPEIIYAIYLGTALANIFMLIVGLAGARLFARAISLPNNILIPLILLLCIVGSYAVSNNYFDIGVMILFGIIGYSLDNLDIPMAPMVLGIVLGPMAETNLRNALIMAQGQVSVLFLRPIAAFFWVITIAMLLWPKLKKRWQARSQEVVTQE
ncbi:MAG: tripartite tricarboxylate transporter permease [Bacillota bacterium]